MRIRKIFVDNIRCIRKAHIDLGTDQGRKNWLVIVGDNGTGKTSLLRCIAIGLCDKNGAAALTEDVPGRLIGKAGDDGQIKITLEDRGKSYEILTKVKKSPAGFETVYQTTKPKAKDFPWKKLFVCGYGACRPVEGSLDYDEYRSADAVYTLFNYEYGLQGPELIIRRLIMEARLAKEGICNQLAEVCMLPKGSIDLGPGGIILKDKGEAKIPWGAIPDGYEATITWIMDIFGWALLAKRVHPNRRLAAIVIIDELEQHLHPKWQREIMLRLRNQFPAIQFIVSTHSPLCAGGTADIPEGRAKLALLERKEDGYSTIVNDLPDLEGLHVSQILASKVFGYLIEANVGTEELLREASVLADKGPNRTPTEERQYQKLKRTIDKLIGPRGQTQVERELCQEKREKLAKEIGELEEKLDGRAT